MNTKKVVCAELECTDDNRPIQNTKYENTKTQKKGKVALRRREMARRAVKMAMDALDLGRVSFDHLLVTQPRIAQSREIHKDKVLLNTQRQNIKLY